MHLKRLEIHGFKSFADTVELEFNDGITAIVGPNGCGKSNISDAIRWVLGEQSAKLLRGNRMEDVIFAGASGRRALGFASVTIVLDNSDKSLPIEFDEVALTRKLYRSGESEYYINKVPCRLKDITDLLYNTGIGKDGYSIISQGQVDTIINSRPEDRREIFDEATGIAKYKYKKQETLKRIEETSDNITRINDIISEIESRLEVLKEQAEKAEKYIELSDKLKVLEINNTLRQLDVLKRKTEKLYNEEMHLSEEIDTLSVERDKVQQEYEQRSDEYSKIKVDIDCANNEIRKIERDVQEYAGKCNVLDERRSYKERDKALLQNRAKALKDLITKNKLLIKDYDKEITQKKKFIERISKAIERLTKNIGMLNNSINQSTDSVNESKVNLRIQVLSMESIISKKKEDLDNLEQEIKKLKSQRLEKQARYDSLNKFIDEKNEQLQSLDMGIKSLEDKSVELKKSHEKFKSDLYHISNEINNATIRLTALTRIKNENDGLNKSVRMLLEACREIRDLPECWPVASVIDIPTKYKIAMEIALGSSFQNIITKTDEDARVLIQYLKQHNMGRVTFMPLNTIRDVNLEFKSTLYLETGFVDYAIKLVKYDKIYEKAVKYLLDRTIVCENIDKAMIISKKYPHKYKIVTIDGEIIYPAGLITGGSINKSKFGVISSDEINKLRLKIKDANESKKAISEKLNALEKEINSISLELNTLASQRKDILNAIESLNVQRQREELDINYLSEKAEEIVKNRDKLVNEQKSLIDDYLQCKERYEDIIAESISSDNNSVKEDKLKLEKLQQKHMKLNVIHARYSEQLSELIDKRMDTANAISSSEDELKKVFEDNEMLQNEIISITKQKEELTSAIQLYNKKKEDLSSKQNALNQRLAELDTEVKRINERLKDLDADLKTKTEKRMGLDVDKTKLELEYNDYKDALWDNYELNPDDAEKYREDVDIDMTEMRNLKNQIKLLGDVNKGAITEYKNTKERYEFLSGQKRDLDESICKLQEVLNDLNAEMKQQFVNQFELIRQSFDRTFKAIFGGGKANISLINPQDVLESGISIDVQPPGKKVQNMQLLSGGEKALSAISLLFAFLSVNPSPFCVLDEIDAALDESNVDRFAEFLRRLCKKLQFIVITHRRGTMMAADCMYGVSMQEKGISKLISVKINEEAV